MSLYRQLRHKRRSVFAARAVCNKENTFTVLVVIGSLNGVLRIFRPHTRAYRLEDQLCVLDLRFPILQVEAGYFTPYALLSTN